MTNVFFLCDMISKKRCIVQDNKAIFSIVEIEIFSHDYVNQTNQIELRATLVKMCSLKILHDNVPFMKETRSKFEYRREEKNL